MKIRITSDTTYEPLSKSIPVIGSAYNLEDAIEGTAAQGRTFHCLLAEYYKSGLWSYQGSGYNQGATLDEFKKLVKRKLGAGFERFYYIDMVAGMPKMHECEKYQDIPAHVRTDPDKTNYIRGVLKSWADYTKQERKSTIDNLISEMHQVGVNTRHFQEILEGLLAG